MEQQRPEMRQTSVYVPMRDGIGLAVDIWQAADGAAKPCLLLSTRYWRAFDLVADNPALQGIHALARYFCSRGYVVLNVDSRGSGASFGTRKAEWSAEEVTDMGDLLDWIDRQPWSNGRVISHGFSYGGNTAFLAAVSGRPNLQAIAPQFADFDIYTDNLYPGGVLNIWLHEAWGRLTAAMDRADVAGLAGQMPGVDKAGFMAYVKGPRPVDGARELLPQALAEHAANFNIATSAEVDICADDATGLNADLAVDRYFDGQKLSIYAAASQIKKSAVTIFYWAGWYDAGTAEGALNLFANFNNSMRVVIGPWNHGRRYFQDPFARKDDPEPIPLEENFSDILATVEGGFSGRRLDYFTYGINAWRSTAVWPLPETVMHRLYLQEGHRLGVDAPSAAVAFDDYEIDPTATTSAANRWHTQIGCVPVLHPDRAGEDAKLLVYDGAPLVSDTELTGHPRVHLSVESEGTDGHFFAYLEMIGPDGRVKLLSEGCLRAAHRKLTASPPYKQNGPAHSYRRADMQPFIPGQVAALDIRLLPISIVVPAKYRLRLAVAGADAHTFAPNAAAAAHIKLHRSWKNPSWMELPVIAGVNDKK